MKAIGGELGPTALTRTCTSTEPVLDIREYALSSPDLLTFCLFFFIFFGKYFFSKNGKIGESDVKALMQSGRARERYDRQTSVLK